MKELAVFNSAQKNHNIIGKQKTDRKYKKKMNSH